jgi:ketosteroid isomerase-like protein
MFCNATGDPMRYALNLPAMTATLLLMCGASASHAQDAEAEIRDLRLRYNDIIERRDVDGFTDILSPTFAELLGSGSVTTGATAVTASYGAIEFRDPAFVAYDRHTDSVEVSSSGRLAVERGHWAARYRGPDGDERCACGGYQAGWVWADDRWRIQTEAYVDLGCDAPTAS